MATIVLQNNFHPSWDGLALYMLIGLIAGGVAGLYDYLTYEKKKNGRR